MSTTTATEPGACTRHGMKHPANGHWETCSPLLVHAGTYRVVECTEHQTLGKGLSLKQAEDALAFYKARQPSARIAILKEWVEPADSPSESDLEVEYVPALGNEVVVGVTR